MNVFKWRRPERLHSTSLLFKYLLLAATFLLFEFIQYTWPSSIEPIHMVPWEEINRKRKNPVMLEAREYYRIL